MMDVHSLKSTLEKICKIASWNPTPSQLEAIANKLSNASPTSREDVEAVVISVCPNTSFMILEGVDNSDIRTLLALAIQIANSKN
jgi:hypothetical protein